MSVLIVGGDHLGSIPRELTKLGATRIEHLTGRDNKGLRNGMRGDMDLVILLYDYVNHNLTKRVKEEARARNIPIVFARRSWSSIYQKVNCIIDVKVRVKKRSGGL